MTTATAMAPSESLVDVFMATDGNVPLVAERFGLSEGEVNRQLASQAGTILNWLRLKSAVVVFDSIKNLQDVAEFGVTELDAAGRSQVYLKMLSTLSELTRSAPTTVINNTNNNVVNNLMQQLPPKTRESVQAVTALAESEFDALEAAFGDGNGTDLDVDDAA